MGPQKKKIEYILKDVDKDFDLIKIKTDRDKEKIITSHLYKIKIKEERYYSRLVKNLDKLDTILDVESVEIF